MGDKAILLNFEFSVDKGKVDEIIDIIKGIDNEAARYMIYACFIINRDDGYAHLARFDPDVWLPIEDVKEILDAIKDKVDLANVEMLNDDDNLVGYWVEDGQIIETRGIFVPANDARLMSALFGSKSGKIVRRLIKEVAFMVEKEE